MKSIKKYIIVVIAFLFFTFSAKSQTSDECKYLTVLIYMQTNTQVNEQVKLFFPRQTKKKDKYVEFNLSALISFVSISNLQERLEKYMTSDTLLNDSRSFYKKYYFDSFKSEFLENLMEQTDSKLFLTFSKPINDFLLAEINDFEPYGSRRFGKGMTVFFKFDKTGLVQSVEFGGAAYN